MAVFRGEALFEAKDIWPRLISRRLRRAVAELMRMTDETAAALAERVDARGFLYEHSFKVPELYREGMDLQRTPLSPRIRGPLKGLSPGDEIRIRIPFNGDAELFGVSPRCIMLPTRPRGYVEEQHLVFEVTLLCSSGERIEPLLQRQWERVALYLIALRQDVLVFGGELSQRLMSLMELRRHLSASAFAKACRSLPVDPETSSAD